MGAGVGVGFGFADAGGGCTGGAVGRGVGFGAGFAAGFGFAFGVAAGRVINPGAAAGAVRVVGLAGRGSSMTGLDWMMIGGAAGADGCGASVACARAPGIPMQPPANASAAAATRATARPRALREIVSRRGTS
jgi:hypothetical protein